MENPSLLFERWYASPLKILHDIPNGDGGFIALATSCFLYERYAIAAIKNSPHSKKVSHENKVNQFMNDFDTDEETARAFWNVIRDGLLHGGMPKLRSHGEEPVEYCALHHEFEKPIELIENKGNPALRVQPWLLMQKVLDLWRQNIELIDKNSSFPWANITTVPF